jgi:C1A family cysteine protease
MAWPDSPSDDAMFHGTITLPWGKVGLGWKAGLPDHRDYNFKDIVPSSLALPPVVSLRSQINWRWNQQNTNGCTSFSSCSAYKFALKKDLNIDFDPSQLFVYFNTRKLEGDTLKDDGAQIRDVFKSVAQYGIAPTTDWPFEVANVLRTPSAKAYSDAKKEILTNYYSVDQNHLEIQQCLAMGYPVVFGTVVCPSFERATNGHIPMPIPNERVLGGHAITLIGYDNNQKVYEFLNSWGEQWGDDGFGWLPQAMVESNNYSDDFWMVKGK